MDSEPQICSPWLHVGIILIWSPLTLNWKIHCHFFRVIKVTILERGWKCVRFKELTKVTRRVEVVTSSMWCPKKITHAHTTRGAKPTTSFFSNIFANFCGSTCRWKRNNRNWPTGFPSHTKWLPFVNFNKFRPIKEFFQPKKQKQKKYPQISKLMNMLWSPPPPTLPNLINTVSSTLFSKGMTRQKTKSGADRKWIPTACDTTTTSQKPPAGISKSTAPSFANTVTSFSWGNETQNDRRVKGGGSPPSTKWSPRLNCVLFSPGSDKWSTLKANLVA